jgi:MFS transporter, DHA1 family, tetracycline resistance protein
VPRIDRDFKLLAVANALYATGLGLYQQLLMVYALHLGASRFTIGLLNALMWAVIMVVNIPGAWAATRFRLKPVLVWTWWLLVPTTVFFFFAPTWEWLIPGLVFFGLAYANMPVFKAYIYLKSERQTVGASMAFIYGSYSLGLVAAPVVGGWIAERYGMRTVFLISTVVYVLSAIVVCFLREAPHHAPPPGWRATDLLARRAFRGHLAFFFFGFLAVYLVQPFVNPFLAQVHRQGYAALGLYSSLVALGGVIALQVVGRLVDRWGARAGAGTALGLIATACLVLLVGENPAAWAPAMLCFGALDTFRLMPSMIVPDTFGHVPLVWGYAVFDTATGVPTVCGAALGGLFYRTSYELPFQVAMAVACGLIVLVLLRGPLVERGAHGVAD